MKLAFCSLRNRGSSIPIDASVNVYMQDSISIAISFLFFMKSFISFFAILSFLITSFMPSSSPSFFCFFNVSPSMNAMLAVMDIA